MHDADMSAFIETRGKLQKRQLATTPTTPRVVPGEPS